MSAMSAMSTVENATPEEPSYTGEGPSKSRRKADAHALQTLGAELVALNRNQLAQVELPELLRDAVEAAQRIHAHEGRRRQLQYIGKLMRNVDAAPIRARIEGWKTVSVEETARLHLIERWRERLLDDPSALQALAGEYPQAVIQEQRQQLRTLIRNTQREREQGKPPKSYRALFQLLRDIIPT
jgi:ribosome-associated protein